MFASVVAFSESPSVGSDALVQAIMSENGILVISFLVAMSLAIGSKTTTTVEEEAPTRTAFINASGSMFGLPI